MKSDNRPFQITYFNYTPFLENVNARCEYLYAVGFSASAGFAFGAGTMGFVLPDTIFAPTKRLCTVTDVVAPLLNQ